MSDYSQGKERRQYYRIDDTAIFSYRIIEQGAEQEAKQLATQELDDSSEKRPAAFELFELFAQMSQQMAATLGRIGEKSPDVASYLKSLDNKIDLLAQMTLFQDQSDLEPRREINLGAGGLAFGTDEKLSQGTLIAMDLVLTTDLLYLHLTGRVIQVSESQEGGYPYRVSVGFTDITDTQVDQISRHIMRLQSEQLRSRREN